MGVGGQCHSLATLPMGKAWYPLYRRLGRPQGQAVWVPKILPPRGFDPRTVQPVASCYTVTIIIVIETTERFCTVCMFVVVDFQTVIYV